MKQHSFCISTNQFLWCGVYRHAAFSCLRDWINDCPRHVVSSLHLSVLCWLLILSVAKMPDSYTWRNRRVLTFKNCLFSRYFSWLGFFRIFIQCFLNDWVFGCFKCRLVCQKNPLHELTPSFKSLYSKKKSTIHLCVNKNFNQFYWQYLYPR